MERQEIEYAIHHRKPRPHLCISATSEDMPGLLAQGRTVIESLEIARDVAKKMMEARAERLSNVKLS